MNRLHTYEDVAAKVTKDKAHKLAKLGAEITTNGFEHAQGFVSGNVLFVRVPRPDRRFKDGVRIDLYRFHKPHHTNMDGLAAIVHQFVSNLEA